MGKTTVLNLIIPLVETGGILCYTMSRAYNISAGAGSDGYYNYEWMPSSIYKVEERSEAYKGYAASRLAYIDKY